MKRRIYPGDGNCTRDRQISRSRLVLYMLSYPGVYAASVRIVHPC